MIGASDHRNSRALVPESQSQRRGVGAPDDSDLGGFREPVRAQPDSPPYSTSKHLPYIILWTLGFVAWLNT